MANIKIGGVIKMTKDMPQIYGYDVEKYIEKALEIMKETYPWATREMFRKEYT